MSATFYCTAKFSEIHSQHTHLQRISEKHRRVRRKGMTRYYNDAFDNRSIQPFCLKKASLGLILQGGLFILSSLTVVTVAWNVQPQQQQQFNGRRLVLESIVLTGGAGFGGLMRPKEANAVAFDVDLSSNRSLLKVVSDPDSYTGLAYSPPPPSSSKNIARPPPLIFVLHGAGQNDLDIRSDLASPTGEHRGLIPSLIASGEAPTELLQNFAVLAPYSYGRTSFYQDPRSKMLRFLNWAIENQNTPALPITFDRQNIWIFGFSDGATVAVELMTTNKFVGGVICSYGYSGKSLPEAALTRLANLPIAVFHSADDAIFDVRNSDRLVKQLQTAHVSSTTNKDDGNDDDDVVRYYRYERDPVEKGVVPANVRGHVSMALVSSRMPELYEWMLSNSNEDIAVND